MKTNIPFGSKSIMIFIGLLVTLLMISTVNAQKVEIYHRTGGEFSKVVMIKVSQKALSAHIAHGDHLASCLEYFSPPAEGTTHQCGDSGGPGVFHEVSPLDEKEGDDFPGFICTANEEVLPTTSECVDKIAL